MTTRPYADAADRYWSVGWANPIPVKGKWPPPNGYTGYGGATVSYPDLQAWKDGDEGAFNIALRLPGDVVGIDVDAHDGRVGAESLNRAEQRLGTLPLGPRSTSRSPWEPSAIRFYRVPPGTNLRGAEKRLRDAFGDHIDVIRRDHRYAVVWPSVHPETHGTYTWYSGTGEEIVPPRPADLPDLPAAWVEFLSAPAAAEPPVPPASGGESPWDLPRQFTREQAVEFNRPHFEALRQAPEGTINNRLNAAAFVLGHFVPAFWSRDEAERWLMTALRETAYDGKTWRAETTIASGLDTPDWRAVLVEPREQVAGTAEDVRLRRGDFTGIAGRRRAEPEYVQRADGRKLLYPGKDSYLYAETESGKSWLAALSVVQCITAGVPVVVVDFEEGDEIEYGQRLMALGLDERRLNNADLFRYLMVDGKCGAEVMTEADDMGARVVIYEGMSVAYDIYGLQVKENDSATFFRRTLVKPHLVQGRAVLTTDHVVKDRETRGRYAIGGVMKLNVASGGAFLLVNVEGLAPGKRGVSNLYITKDRPGGVKRFGVPAGEKFDPQVRRFGQLVVDDSRTFVNYLDVQILAPRAEDVEIAPQAAPTDKILAAIRGLEQAGRTPSMNAVLSELEMRKQAFGQEVERMLTRGLINETPGPRNSRILSLRSVPEEEE